MLSYQHGFHAGNLADVHKHAVLAVALDYLTGKDKPLSYLETHAGRALYDLGAPEALKTAEARAGIVRAEASGWFAPDHPYARVLARVRAVHGPRAYPGSPLIAAALLRPDDRMTLAELHPQEHAALAAAMTTAMTARLTTAMTTRPTVGTHAGTARPRVLPAARVLREDGLAMILAQTPPVPRRGLVLIDPSFEIKSDYHEIPAVIRALHRRWNVGIIMLWYPLLASGAHLPMLATLSAEGFPGAVRHEVATVPRTTKGSGPEMHQAKNGHAGNGHAENGHAENGQAGRRHADPAQSGRGMRGSGLFIVNAPWGLVAETDRLGALFADL